MNNYWQFLLKKEKVSIIGILIVPLIFISIFTFVLMPPQKKEIARLKYEVDLFRKFDKVKELREMSRSRIKDFYSGLYSESDLSSILKDVELAAKENDLYIETVVPGSQSESIGELCKEAEIKIRLVGKYHSLGKFLSMLENKGSNFSVSRLNVLSTGMRNEPHKIDLVLNIMLKAREPK